MLQRLQKILSSSGVCSRRKAEDYIAAGRITVNGVVSAVGCSADPDLDVILFDGKPLPQSNGFIYIMLNKPSGYVTTMHDEYGRKTVCDLIREVPARVYPVGRLDYETEGLLFLTNDGEFANFLTHPRYTMNKCYEIVADYFDEGSLKLLERRIEIDGKMISKPEIEAISTGNNGYVLRVTIHEGRNRQVRKMCAAAGISIRKLTRVSEGPVSLGDLKSGYWRYLKPEEVKELYGK